MITWPKPSIYGGQSMLILSNAAIYHLVLESIYQTSIPLYSPLSSPLLCCSSTVKTPVITHSPLIAWRENSRLLKWWNHMDWMRWLGHPYCLPPISLSLSRWWWWWWWMEYAIHWLILFCRLGFIQKHHCQRLEHRGLHIGWLACTHTQAHTPHTHTPHTHTLPLSHPAANSNSFSPATTRPC